MNLFIIVKLTYVLNKVNTLKIIELNFSVIVPGIINKSNNKLAMSKPVILAFSYHEPMYLMSSKKSS